MIATHKRICFDDEGKLECVCRWAQTDVMSPRPAGWYASISRTLFRCAAGHRILSDRPVEVCMRMVDNRACLQPVEEVTE